MSVETRDPVEDEILRAFVDESDEAMAGADEHLVALETDPRNRERLDAVFRAFHSIKGNSSFFGLLELKKLAHALEDVLSLARDGKLVFDRAVMDALLAGVDRLKGMLARVRAGESEDADPAGLDALVARLASLQHGAAGPAAPESAGPVRETASAADPSVRTMRVEERRIDEFLDYVGELIIVREMFATVGKRLRGDRNLIALSAEYQRALGAFTSLSHALQHSIMEVRKVPVRAVLQKLPRIVRDLAAETGKQAQVEVVGAEVAVDKSLVEALEAPIVHMVRNALDHGVEKPAARAQAGKPPAGTIRVSVVEGADEVTVSIEDDGRGIDAEALRRKAVANGVITASAAERLEERQSFELMFEAGLSTAAAVTSVSGRGVGMDVVKRNVDSLGGRISVESERGKGSRIRLHLPKAVTVQILDGFLVQVGRERFVLPLHAVHESFRPSPSEVFTVAEQGECIQRRGRILPLVRFASLLRVPARREKPTEAIVVAIDVKGGGVAGLMVDEVLGTQQVVLRDVAGLESMDALFSGGAVLGDGRVAMVVDPERLGALAS